MRAVHPPTGVPHPKSVLWVAAHPDDEAVVAPLLAAWCRDQGAHCGLMLLTRGEDGACLRPGGCLPDVATVRSAEAGAASQYFGADSILLALGDGGGAQPPAWNPTERPDIVNTVAAYIQAFDPELVLTFDPRHGTTCHPDHRAVGTIVLEAVQQLSPPPAVYLLETKVSIATNPLAIQFYAATPAAERYDANTILASTQQPAWNAVIEDMQHHASQFTGEWIAAAHHVPASGRAVFFGPAAAMLEQPVEPCS